MAAAVLLRDDFDGPALRRLEKGTKEAAQTRRLLALAEIRDGGSRSDAARVYCVPCLHCGHMAPIAWARIQWPDGRRDRAYSVCEACGGIHHEHEKPRLLEAGKWRQTTEGDGRTAGFHLSALYSPWETWAEIATEHGRVRKDPARLQVWVNTKLGESWDDQAGDTVPADPLMARREDWGEALPASVAVLTAGVDVQGDRIEVQIVGWGRDEEAWVIDYRVLWGDPSGPRLWSVLDMVLQATFPHPPGSTSPCAPPPSTPGAAEMAERVKAIERDNRELRQANEILRKASAYFAMAEIDRRSK